MKIFHTPVKDPRSHISDCSLEVADVSVRSGDDADVVLVFKGEQIRGVEVVDRVMSKGVAALRIRFLRSCDKDAIVKAARP